MKHKEHPSNSPYASPDMGSSYGYNKNYNPCENGCLRKATFKKQYDAYICAVCKDKLENAARRTAIATLQKSWRERHPE